MRGGLWCKREAAGLELTVSPGYRRLPKISAVKYAKGKSGDIDETV